MNQSPGPTEEVGKTALSIVEALRAQPLVLAIVLINVLFMALIFWSVREQSARKDELIADLVRKVAACPAAITLPPR